MKQIVCFGDSIMKGIVYNGSRYCKSVAALQKKLSGAIVENYSRMGATILDFPKQLSRCKESLQGAVVLLGFGGNDCDHTWDAVSADIHAAHAPNVLPEKYEEAYCAAISALKQRGAVPVVLNLLPIHASRYFHWISQGRSAEHILQWLGDESMLYRWQESYNRQAEHIAEETDCSCIDVRTPFLQNHSFDDLFCQDGIHPTEKGYNLFHETVAAALQAMEFKTCCAPFTTQVQTVAG